MPLKQLFIITDRCGIMQRMDILAKSFVSYKRVSISVPHTALVVNVNRRESFILQLWAPSLTRTIPISSLTRNMDWRIFFVTMPQGKTSHFPTPQTRNHPKQRAARCYVTVYSPFTAAPRETQTAFGFWGNPGFNCSSRGSFLTPRVCPAHTAQMCLQQRGVLERADRTATPHPKSVFSPKKTKAEPWCRRNKFGFT